MNILLKHIITNMKENIGRTLLIMLSLFVVSMLVAIVSAAILFITMISDANKSTYEYMFESSTGEYILNDVVDEVKKEFNILALSDCEYGYIQDKDENYISAALGGIKINDAINFKFIEINEENVELNENEVIITSAIAKAHKLKEGDEFKYYGRNNVSHNLRVKYVVAQLGNNDIITNEQTYLKIIDENEIMYRMLFASAKNENLTNEDINKIELEWGLHVTQNEQELDMIKQLLYPAVIVGILIFAVIFVSLNSIIKIILNERIPVIGTFRSVGATKKQVIWILIIELLMYTVIPAVIGSVAGVFAIKGVASMIELTLQALGSSKKINVVNYIFPLTITTVSVTVIFQMLLSVIEILKVSKISIKDSIFNKHTSIYKYSKTKIIFGIFFLALGIVNIIKYSQLTYWYCLAGILSVFVSIALIVPTVNKYLTKLLEKVKNPVIAMAINTLKNSTLQINTNIIFIITVSVALVVYSFFNYVSIVEKAKQNRMNSDVYVEEIGTVLMSMYDKTNEFYKLENVKSVSSILDITIDKQRYDEIKLANHSINQLHLVYSENYKDLLKDSNLLNIDMNMVDNLKKDEVIVSDYYKKIYGLKQGDTFVLEWQTNEENFALRTPINLKIVGFTDLSKLQNNTIIISSDFGQELSQLLFNGFTNTKYFINLKDNSNEAAKEARKAIISELGINSNGTTGMVYTKEGYIQIAKENSETMMKFMTIIVVAITGLALIGIINNQTVSFMERRRELATLYSIAMSRKQLKNMILIENVLAFISSLVTSIIFYIIISKLVEYTLQVLLMPISIKFTISGVLILLLVVSMILFAIQKSMRNHIKNMNIVEEIKYE